MIAGFLGHLEHERHNTVRTRNARLAAIRSMFRYASYREPAHAALIQRVLAIPDKRARHPVVSFLSPAEVDALLVAPDRTTWIGRRDHALLVTAVQTGLASRSCAGCAATTSCSASAPTSAAMAKAARNAAHR